MKLFFSVLCAALLLVMIPAARACRYCEMMNSDPESRRLSSQVGGQDFPLEGITSQYQAAPPPASLTTPPPAASVATKAADLPTTANRRAVPPPPVVAAAPVKTVLTTTPTLRPAASSHWADAGLLSLLGAGGFFCWRTRRATTPLA